MAKERWTNSDEEQLEQLIARKKRITDINMEPVLAIAKELMNYNIDQLADEMVKFADAIRDALEPFDSGVRLAPPPIIVNSPNPNDKQYVVPFPLTNCSQHLNSLGLTSPRTCKQCGLGPCQIKIKEPKE